MNRAELSARIATETSLSTASANGAVTGLFSTIDDALASGQTNRVVGFGTFLMRSRAARHSRNPRARARALPSRPRRRLQSRPARPSARPSNIGFGEPEYRRRTVPLRSGMNGSGTSSGALSAPPVRCRSPENPIRRTVRSRRNQIARDVLANVAGSSWEFCRFVARAYGCAVKRGDRVPSRAWSLTRPDESFLLRQCCAPLRPSRSRRVPWSLSTVRLSSIEPAAVSVKHAGHGRVGAAGLHAVSPPSAGPFSQPPQC